MMTDQTVTIDTAPIQTASPDARANALAIMVANIRARSSHIIPVEEAYAEALEIITYIEQQQRGS